jgi:hypothetical protein
MWLLPSGISRCSGRTTTRYSDRAGVSATTNTTLMKNTPPLLVRVSSECQRGARGSSLAAAAAAAGTERARPLFSRTHRDRPKAAAAGGPTTLVCVCAPRKTLWLVVLMVVVYRERERESNNSSSSRVVVAAALSTLCRKK